MSAVAENTDLRVDISNKQIINIALPIAAAMLIPNLNFITNNIFLSNLGQRELAVAGITGVYYLIFAMIGLGLNNGLQALISRRAGENRPEEIGKIFTQGIIVSALLAITGVIITYTLTPTIFRFALHDQNNVQMAVDFLNIRIWGLFFLYIYQMRNALLVGINQTKLLYIATLAETLANVFFDYVFIYGELGFPKLGFNGAAYASVIAEFTGMFILFLILKKKGISKRFRIFAYVNFDTQNFNLILQISFPLMLQFALSLISWEFFYILIERNGNGTVDLAISNVMRNVFGFFGCFSWAFAAAANAMVSNVIGQGLQHRVHELINKIMRMSLAFAVSVCIIINIIPGEFLSIYGQSEAFIIQGIPVLRVISTALIIMSITVVWLNAVTGTGNTKITLYTEVFAIIFYCIYVWIVLEKLHLPVSIAWMSEWLYWICMLVPSFIYIRSGRWRIRRSR